MIRHDYRGQVIFCLLYGHWQYDRLLNHEDLGCACLPHAEVDADSCPDGQANCSGSSSQTIGRGMCLCSAIEN